MARASTLEAGRPVLPVLSWIRTATVHVKAVDLPSQFSDGGGECSDRIRGSLVAAVRCTCTCRSLMSKRDCRRRSRKLTNGRDTGSGLEGVGERRGIGGGDFVPECSLETQNKLVPDHAVPRLSR